LHPEQSADNEATVLFELAENPDSSKGSDLNDKYSADSLQMHKLESIGVLGQEHRFS